MGRSRPVKVQYATFPRLSSTIRHRLSWGDVTTDVSHIVKLSITRLQIIPM